VYIFSYLFTCMHYGLREIKNLNKEQINNYKVTYGVKSYSTILIYWFIDRMQFFLPEVKSSAYSNKRKLLIPRARLRWATPLETHSTNSNEDVHVQTVSVQQRMHNIESWIQLCHHQNRHLTTIHHLYVTYNWPRIRLTIVNSFIFVLYEQFKKTFLFLKIKLWNVLNICFPQIVYNNSLRTCNLVLHLYTMYYTYHTCVYDLTWAIICLIIWSQYFKIWLVI
jgi:hypothetical protein